MYKAGNKYLHNLLKLIKCLLKSYNKFLSNPYERVQNLNIVYRRKCL